VEDDDEGEAFRERMKAIPAVNRPQALEPSSTGFPAKGVATG
ncbi:hypothetical protein Pgy4_39530, partial [Pseudomonas savastanoi pv. glycinea str. race 4]